MLGYGLEGFWSSETLDAVVDMLGDDSPAAIVQLKAMFVGPWRWLPGAQRASPVSAFFFCGDRAPHLVVVDYYRLLNVCSRKHAKQSASRAIM